MTDTQSFTDDVSIDGDLLIFQCPNCFDFIQVLRNELNCKIFRHACNKQTFQCVNSHLSLNDCENLKKSDTVYGCIKPFMIVQLSHDKYKVQCCGYI